MTTQTLKDIFAPTWTRLITAVSLAVFTHFFILVVQVRQSATADLGAVKHFWLTNFINALPYLETQNTFLKFLTFFSASYVLVWVVTRLFYFFSNLQQLTIKHLRKNP